MTSLGTKRSALLSFAACWGLSLAACAAEIVPDASDGSSDDSIEGSSDGPSSDASGEVSTDGTGEGSSETGSSSGDGDSSGAESGEASSSSGDGDSSAGDGDSASGDGDMGGDGDGDLDPPDGICEGVCGSIDCGPCPDLSTVDVLDFAIGAYEVTNAEYQVFTELTHNMDAQPDVCSWNASYDPSDGWPAAFAEQDHPVAYVDWCDAKAYCKWAGMHMCGGRISDNVPYLEWDNPGQSQWMAACSDDGNFSYPYGDDYEAGFCNGVDAGLGAVVQVGLMVDCEGSVDGLFDMSGNVWEWEDGCEDATGATDSCRRRGGSRFSDATILRCAVGSGRPRNHTDNSTGIRCCAD